MKKHIKKNKILEFRVHLDNGVTELGADDIANEIQDAIYDVNSIDIIDVTWEYYDNNTLDEKQQNKKD